MKSYTIRDDKNIQAYYSLVFGIKNNDLEAFKAGIKGKALLEKLSLRDERTNKLIPAISFVKKFCSNEILEEMSPVEKMSDQLKFQTVVKEIIDSDADPKGVVSLIKKYFNNKNVNKLFPIKTLSRPFDASTNDKMNVSLFHVACHHLNVDAVETLVLLGADVDAKITGLKLCPVRIVSSRLQVVSTYRRKKANQIVLILFNAKANFNVKDAFGNPIWENLIKNMSIPVLTKIIEGYTPVNLKSVDLIAKRSFNLKNHWFKVSKKAFEKYPLIYNFQKHEKLDIFIEKGLGDVNDVEKFLKHKSLKSAVKERYGVSSPRMNDFINESVLFKNMVRRQVLVSKDGILKADFLKEVFLDRKNPNVSDFLEMLRSAHSHAIALGSVIKEDNRRSLMALLNLFNDDQIKSLLSRGCDDDVLSYSGVDDAAEMFGEYQAELTELIKTKDFKDINSLKVIHDLFVEEVQKLKHKDFDLNQEDHFPMLKELGKISLPLNHGVIAGKTSHELLSWGRTMNHCVGTAGYATKAKKGLVTILAITENGSPKYCVEIIDKSVNQVQGYSNSRPPQEVMDQFKVEMKKLKVLK